MAHTELETKQQIYESLRSGLTGRITKLTNFTDRSFNYVWTQAFSQEVRELQELALVSELAGFIDYTGGPITEDDLEDLGLEEQITAERVNELMNDDYLDEYVKIVGVTRNEGSVATGTVTFSTQNTETTIESGTRVTTAPQSDGTTTDFLTTETVSTSAGETSVSDVPIESTETGSDYNVPAGTITRISNPPVGVTGVNNPESTTGGEDRETNDSLRERAKSAIGGASEGGTVEGIKAYIRNNIDGVQQGDVILDEFVNQQPPYVDVIVDGGLDSEVSSAIEFSRPTGIRHNLIRPQVIQIGASIDLLGSDIDLTVVENRVETFLLELGVSQEFYEDQIIREIMQSDDDIISIDFLDTTIERVTNEAFEYDTSVDAAIADDGGTTTDETALANNSEINDMTLLPSSPSVGDAYYFGEETVFSELDLAVSQAGVGTWDIVWEYYDGANWTSLPNVTDGTNDFQTANTNTVTWDMPGDWASLDFADTMGLYFIRARLDTFSDMTTQPRGEQVFITGNGHRLDYTFEHRHGSMTVEDRSGDIYAKGTDFELLDTSGDSWPETLVWTPGATPDEDESFFVDYDVTVPGETLKAEEYDADLVRDESFWFNEDDENVFTYNNSEQTYELDHVPFEDSVTIVDENTTTFDEDLDWQLTPTQDYANYETFTFSDGQNQYNLSEEVGIDFSAVYDADGNIYIRDADYTMTSTDSDPAPDAIRFGQDIDGAVADDGGVTTDETTEANNETADDMTLLPGTPAAGDAYYFGHETVFGGFDLNISTVGDGQWTFAWEYYDGTAWQSLSNVVDDTDAFRNTGINAVDFKIPTDWATTDVGGVTGLYWVRARVDTFNSISQQPLGQEVEIGRKPDDTLEFTVVTDAYPDGIRWDPNNDTPPQDDDFTVTYDQVYYESEYEIEETPLGEIRDVSGDTYDEGVGDYHTVDEDRDGEIDGIYWDSNPATLGDGEEFFLTYFTEGDIFFGDREKADPGTIDASSHPL